MLADTYDPGPWIDTDIPKGATLDAPVYSASQISTYLECKRKWAFQTLAKEPRVQHKSAALGSRVHAQLEAYLRDGRELQYTFPPDHELAGHPDESAEIAFPVLEHLPPPKSFGLEVEKGFFFRSPRTGNLYRGFIDWRKLGWPDPGTITVGDHKTTSSFGWAKTEEDLLTDPQSILYAVDTMGTYRVSEVRLQWTYTQTRGARRALPVVQTVQSAHVAEVFRAIEATAQEMTKAREGFPPAPDRDPPTLITEQVTDIRNRVLELEPSPEACEAYGGCPFRFICQLSPAERMTSLLSRATPTSTWLDRLNTAGTRQPKQLESGGGAIPSELESPPGGGEKPRLSTSGVPQTRTGPEHSESTGLVCKSTETCSMSAGGCAGSVANLCQEKIHTSTTTTVQGESEGSFADRAMSESECSKKTPSYSAPQPNTSAGESMSSLLDRLKSRTSESAAATTDPAPQAPAEPPTDPSAQAEAMTATEVAKTLAPPVEGVDYAQVSAPAAVVAPGQINPPEAQAAAPITVTEAPKRGRGRPRKSENAGAGTVAPSQSAAPIVDTGDRRIPILYVNCIPLQGDVLMAEHLAEEANARVESETGKADWRFLEFGQGPGALSRAAMEILDSREGALPPVVVDTRTPEGTALLTGLTVRAQAIVRGL